MLSEMRSEVRQELDRCVTKRPPVLRRADVEDALFATDLPAVASQETVMAFTKAMKRLGWQVRPAVIWLHLDKTVPVPPAREVRADGEMGCCLSLLQRHPKGVQDEKAVRLLCKAGEQNAMVLEKVCAGLHRQWAEKLRLGQPLPGLLMPYLQEAIWEVQQK